MTISDIAKMAGVSSAAVSRYLNGGPLSEQKREAIREVVEKTGYRPDAAAQTLRTGRVNQIGVIAPSISSQSVGQITAGIASELDQQNYLILLGNTELDEQRELGYLTAMQRNHVAGIILLGSYYTPQLAQALKNCRVPVVVTGQRFQDVACVYNDDRTAARELAQRMLDHGRRRIVYIGGTERDDATGVQRREGVQDALNAAGLNGEQMPRICCNAFTMEEGQRCMQELLVRCPDLDGVVCVTDTPCRTAPPRACCWTTICRPAIPGAWTATCPCCPQTGATAPAPCGSTSARATPVFSTPRVWGQMPAVRQWAKR